MKKTALAASFVLTTLLPFVASAHEHGTYQIGKNYYQIVIGSLNEPVAVDDKTGLDLTVTKCRTSACMPSMGADGDMDGPAGAAVTGLDQTLKVELQAGGQTKQMAIKPQWGKDGAYTAAFYPTAATTYSYRLMGAIDGTPIDLTYQCLADGGKAADEKTPKQIANDVTQMTLEGGFGCPSAKEDLGFPLKSAAVSSLGEASSSAKSTGMFGIAIAVLALVVAGYATVKKSV